MPGVLSCMGDAERGQGTVEWVGLVCLVSLLLVGLLAAGVRVPGTALARAVASRILCAAALADGCGDEPALIAAYGTEVGGLVRRHMPSLLFERGSRAVPVDFRRCRSTACGDAAEHGYVRRTDAGLPVSAFVHVVDCRPDAVAQTEAEGADCSGPRAGNLYIQYWTYYADSATLRGVPIVGDEGFHRDDWEGVQIRIRPDGSRRRARLLPQRLQPRPGSRQLGLRRRHRPAQGRRPKPSASAPDNGWGPETHILLVSGGSHAGNAGGIPRIERLTPRNRVHLIPLEPIAAASQAHFAITPPWRKRVWRDPEAEGTD